jgi:hypothetical protein
MEKAGAGKTKKIQKQKNRRFEVERMRNILRHDEILFRRKLAKKLEFGHTFTSSYKKHLIMPKNIFWNQNIRAYCSYNEKNLHVWKPDTEEQLFHVNFFDETKSHAISYLVYSKRY